MDKHEPQSVTGMAEYTSSRLLCLLRVSERSELTELEETSVSTGRLGAGLPLLLIASG